MIHRLCMTLSFIHILLWHDFYDKITDHTTLLYGIKTQIRPLLELCSFYFINEFYLTEVFNC